MNATPRGNRLQLGIFGRVNAGKSTLLNLLAGQDTAVTSAVAGTTTDLVEKAMELLPLGPVLFLDTPGAGDATALSSERLERTSRAMQRADVALLVVESGIWGSLEDSIVAQLAARRTPIVAIVNKCDTTFPSPAFLDLVKRSCAGVVCSTATNVTSRDALLRELKTIIASVRPDRTQQPPLVADLVPPGGVVVLVVPIDLQAPLGRLILPQVQTIRETLDVDATAIVVKERELAGTLRLLNRPPDLVVCDSQSILKVLADVPSSVKCTTFSILFARAKGDLAEAARGAARIGGLRSGASVLIAEGCTHHALEDDIGRVKIPRWLRQYVGGEVDVNFVSGSSFPKTVSDFDLIVHCGACTLNRKEMVGRVDAARKASVPITNYGLSIAFVQGVLRRVLEPFPAALAAYDAAAQPNLEEAAC
jgi:[FeFe] hydrogenase H-cluster maturation GTPase HydF